MKTEEEARKCWCPFYRMTATGDHDREWHDNRGSRTDTMVGESSCIASDCMAWREVKYHNWHAEVQGLLASGAPGAKIDAIKVWRLHSGVGLKEAKQAVERVIDRSLELSASPREGYCGLAGKP